MDSGTSCEVIYKHCFLKLKPSIMSLRIDSKTPLVGFSGEHSWPLGEVPLEITIGDSPYARTEILNFVIVRYNSPHNLLLGRNAMQRMGIVVSTIHEAIKFHTPRGIGTLFLTRPIQAKNIIQEIQQGSCGMHIGPRSVVSKITKLGYYWPSMHNDAKALIQRCKACQIHSSILRKLKQEMTPITSAWPFFR
ncbi:reverse transcriptase domain-containing protein [Tanacetum coccineum]